MKITYDTFCEPGFFRTVERELFDSDVNDETGRIILVGGDSAEEINIGTHTFACSDVRIMEVIG